MKIQEMKLILEIVETVSISAAAKKLYISQPALSQTVKKIEDELGTPLFIRRSGKMLELTKAGKSYAQMAEHIVPVYENFLEQLRISAAPKHILRAGLPQGQGHFIMNALLESQTRLKQAVSFEFVEGVSDYLENLVLKDELDFAVLRLPLKYRDLQYQVILHEPLGIWLRRGSDWASKGRPSADPSKSLYASLPLDCLKGETLLLPPSGKRIRATIDSIIQKGRLAPAAVKTYDSMKTIRLMVNNGLGSAIGKAPAPNEPTDLFFWIEDYRSSYDLAFIWREDCTISSVVKELAGVLASCIVP